MNIIAWITYSKYKTHAKKYAEEFGTVLFATRKDCLMDCRYVKEKLDMDCKPLKVLIIPIIKKKR